MCIRDRISGTGTFRPMEGSNPFSGELNVRENVYEEMIFRDFREF